jgi:hypothetical protein
MVCYDKITTETDKWNSEQKFRVLCLILLHMSSQIMSHVFGRLTVPMSAALFRESLFLQTQF